MVRVDRRAVARVVLLRPTALTCGLELEIHVPGEDSYQGMDVRLLSLLIFTVDAAVFLA
jgi:hypothetical protein